MMKFLRKYNRTILGGLVIFILISWLIGAPLQELLTPDQSAQAVGSAFGGTVRSRDLVPSLNTTTILDNLGINWQTIGSRFSPEPKPLRIEHWWLLSREAQEAGITVTESDVDEALKMLGASSPLLDSVRSRLNVSLDDIRAAVAEYRRIGRYAEMAMEANIPSEPQVRHFVRDTQDKIVVRAVTFPAGRFVEPDEPVSPEEAQAHFEKYKNSYPGESDYGFGYKWPRRVRVEYLAAYVSDLMPQIAVSEEEMRRHYRKNKDLPEYKRREIKPPATQPTTQSTTAPTQPAKPELIEHQIPFSEMKEQIERQLKEAAATSRARTVMEQVAGELAKPWLGVPLGSDGYKPLPDEVKTADYLSSAVERFGQKFRVPLTYHKTELLTQEQARVEPKIGGAATPGEGDDRLYFADYAFRIPGFYDAAKLSETEPRLALFQTPDTPIYNSRTGRPHDQFVFRVIEAVEPQVPASWTEVKDAVERDVRLLRGYRRAEQRAREFFVSARVGGVDAAFVASPDLKDPKYAGGFGPQSSAPFPRREPINWSNQEEFIRATIEGRDTFEPPYIGIVNDRIAEFVDRCFDMVSPLFVPPTVELPPTTRPVATRPADVTSVVVNLIDLPKNTLWVVAELKRHEPVRQDQYAEGAQASARQQIMFQRYIALQTGWFDPAHIEQRTGFVRAKTAEGEDVEAVPIAPAIENPGGYF